MASFEKSVFINCPFDTSYFILLKPLLFTIVYLEFFPKIALERSDSCENRITKIEELIKDSKYSIHDLSRIRSAKKNEVYRMNMPFELGIDYGCRKYSSDHGLEKKQLILEKDPYTYRMALSDISGFDIKYHNNEPMNLVRVIRDWFVETVGIKGLKGPTEIWNKYNDFVYYLTVTRLKKGFSEKDIDQIPITEYLDVINEWKS
jgi:hypothetical protein